MRVGENEDFLTIKRLRTMSVELSVFSLSEALLSVTPVSYRELFYWSCSLRGAPRAPTFEARFPKNGLDSNDGLGVV